LTLYFLAPAGFLLILILAIPYDKIIIAVLTFPVTSAAFQGKARLKNAALQ